MRILLGNDDGIQSVGIEALVKALAPDHELIVAAPAKEQSGMAHALTVHKKIETAHYAPLEEAYAIKALSIDGTPTDCIKLYLEALAGENKPDLVISGINHGANLGTDVLYSGTVGAAMEGYLHGITSLAVSLDLHSEIPYDTAAKIVAEHLKRFFQQERQPFFYNLNFPKKFLAKGPEFVFTKLGNRDYLNAFQRSTTPDGRVYYLMAGEIYDSNNSEATDIYAVGQGYISITPLQTDLTDYLALDARLRK